MKAPDPLRTDVPPELSIERGRLEGWEEFDKWAYFNSLEWYKASQEAYYENLNEMDKMRVAVAYMIRSCAHYKKTLMENASLNLNPAFLIPSNP